MPRQGSGAGPAGNRPKKRVVRRKKKRDEPYTLPDNFSTESGSGAPSEPLYDWGDGKGRVYSRPKKNRGRHEQPGPVSDAERRRIRAAERSEPQQEARQEARKHGPGGRRGTKRPGGDDKSDYDRSRGRKASERAIKQARIDYLRRSRPRGRELLKRELEGRGLLADLLSEVGEKVGERVEAGHERHVLGSSKASIGTTSGKLLGRAAEDAVNLPAQAVPSVYVPVAGVKEAVLDGDPKRLKKLLKDVDETSVIYNLAAAGVEAVGGDSKAAKQRLKQAKESAEEHPGFAVAELVGAKAVAGRSAGSAARHSPSKKLRRIGSTKRKPRTLEGTNIQERRTYSPDLIDKAVQVGAEKFNQGRVTRLRRKADRVEAKDPDRAAELRGTARRVDTSRVSEKYVRRRVDERVALNEDVRRINRSEATKAVDKAVKGLRRSERPIVSLVAQNIVRPNRKSLEKYRAKLAREAEDLKGHKLRANKAVRRAIDNVLADPKADLDRVADAARVIVESSRPLQDDLVAAGLLDADQADKAAVMPYAVAQMDARGVSDEYAKTQRKDAKEELGRVTKRLERLERLRQQRIGQNRSARGREGQVAAYYVGERRFASRAGAQKHADENGGSVRRVALSSAEAKRTGELSRIDRAIERVKAEKRVAEGKLRDARRLDAELLDADGRPLSAAAIHEHMEANEVPEPAFLTQAPNQRGAKNFNLRSERANTLRTRRRTGEATRQGTFDIHEDTLREGAARARGLVDAVEGWNGFLDELALRSPDNGELLTFPSFDKARQVADDLNVPGEREWSIVRVTPWGARKKQLQRVLEETHPDALMDAEGAKDAPIVQALREALDGNPGGEGPWAIVPGSAADQLRLHLNSMGQGTAAKLFQMYNSAFRKTVLATSTSWFAGNVLEASLRSALATAGPRSWVTGRRVMTRLKEFDPEAAKEMSVRALGGGQYSFAQRAHVRRGADQFAGTGLEGIAQTLGKLWRTPGPRHVADAWHAYTDFVFGRLNKGIESQFQTAMLGKALRGSDLMDDHLVKLSRDAVDDAARGLTDTNNQVAFGRAVDRMYGRYGKLSPNERLIFAYYTPFMAWARNAAEFITRTLPVDHPVATGVLAALENATEEWREDHRLDHFIEGGQVPFFLQGAIPTSDGLVRASRFTPFSLAGDPFGTAADQVLPQFSSVLMAMQGRDWKGDKLRNEDGEELNVTEQFMAAAHELVKSSVPLVAQGERISEDGVDALNPFRPVKNEEKPKVTTKRKKVVRKKREPAGFFDESEGFFDGGGSSSSGSSSGKFFADDDDFYDDSESSGSFFD